MVRRGPELEKLVPNPGIEVLRVRVAEVVCADERDDIGQILKAIRCRHAGSQFQLEQCTQVDGADWFVTSRNTRARAMPL